MNSDKDKKKETQTIGTLIESGRYVEAIGRRKRAVARVRVREEKVTKLAFLINERQLHEYFQTENLRVKAKDPLSKLKNQNQFSITALVKGSGVSSQADAVRHGLSKVFASLDVEWKKKLKKAGFLKPDIRIKERKKFGKKKARKSPQWSKR